MTALGEAFAEKYRGLESQLLRVRIARKNLQKQEAEIMRDLADCKSAARLFDVTLQQSTVPADSISIRQFALNALLAAGESGIRAREIEAAYEAATGNTVHPKTVGMTLFRLKTAGQANRVGHAWHAG